MAKWVLAAALAVGMCAPSGEGEGQSSDRVAPVDGVLGSAQNGTVQTIAVGDTLSVELESIPTAGYIWVVKDQPSFLALLDEATRPTHPEVQNQPGFTGGNHYLRFDFKATAAGEGRLVLVEGRPWELEDGGAPDDVWSITVKAE